MLSLRILVSIYLVIFRNVCAAPAERRTLGRDIDVKALHPRDTNSTPSPSPNGLSIQVWLPLLAILGVIIGMIVFSYVKRRRMRAAMLAARRANGVAATEGDGVGVNQTGRRPRRTRRTPSQISTKSLPAYNEDPGEQEIVIARSTRESEDPMPTHNEEQDESQSDIRTPLLEELPQHHLVPPQNDQARRSQSFDTIRMGSDDSHAQLIPRNADVPHPSAEELRSLGDAPAYFEVVDQNQNASNSVEMNEMSSSRTADRQLTNHGDARSADSHTTGTSTARTPSGRRRKSGIRDIASRLSRLITTTSSSNSNTDTTIPGLPIIGPSTAPPLSFPSTLPSTSSASTSPPPLPPLPHSQPSSSSLFVSPPHTSSITANRPMSSHLRSSSSVSVLASRIRSASPHPPISFGHSHNHSDDSPGHNPAASASTISLSSRISAPLSHTLTRTTFQYPSSGPTAEQVKFISSMESVGRFGVPYGDAATTAMTQSREVLSPGNGRMTPPPPPFDAPAYPGLGPEPEPRDSRMPSPSVGDDDGAMGAEGALAEEGDHEALSDAGTSAREGTFDSEDTSGDTSFASIMDASFGSISTPDTTFAVAYSPSADAGTPSKSLALHISPDVHISPDTVTPTTATAKWVPTPPITPRTPSSQHSHPQRQSSPSHGLSVPIITVAPATPVTMSSVGQAV